MESGSRRALRRSLRGELGQAVPEYPVEGWEWMDDVGKRLQRSAEFDCQHELAHDLACAGRDQVAPTSTPRARSATSFSTPR